MLIVVIQDAGIGQDMLEHIIDIIDIIVGIVVELIDTIILGDIIKWRKFLKLTKKKLKEKQKIM